MMKRKRSIILIISIIVLIIGAICANKEYVLRQKENVKQKSIKARYLQSENIKYAEELIDKENQAFEIDNYIITLKKAIYDSETRVGYAVIEYVKKGGKPYIKLDKWGRYENNHDMVEERFLVYNQKHLEDYEYVGDKLYHYIVFNIGEDEGHTLKLVDTKQKDGSSVIESETYEFKLKEKSKAKTVEMDDDVCVKVSTLGIYIKTIKEPKKINVKAHFNDGSVVELIDAKEQRGVGFVGVDFGKITRENEENPGCVYVKIFDAVIDVNNIEYITYNGEKYKID